MSAEIACFIQDPIFVHVFFLACYLPGIGKICHYSNVNVVDRFYITSNTRGTIFFIPQNAQLLTRCHLIGISKVACWGRGFA